MAEKTFLNLFRAETGELSLTEKQKKDLARNADLVAALRWQHNQLILKYFHGKELAIKCDITF